MEDKCYKLETAIFFKVQEEFSLCIKCFLSTTPDKLENPTTISNFGVVFEEKLARKSRDFHDVIVFKVFSFHAIDAKPAYAFLKFFNWNSVFESYRSVFMRDGRAA